jgi:hypothetical protein
VLAQALAMEATLYVESEGDADVAPTSETIRVPDAVLTVRRGDFAGVFALLRESASYLKEI